MVVQPAGEGGEEGMGGIGLPLLVDQAVGRDAQGHPVPGGEGLLEDVEHVVDDRLQGRVAGGVEPVALHRLAEPDEERLQVGREPPPVVLVPGGRPGGGGLREGVVAGG